MTPPSHGMSRQRGRAYTETDQVVDRKLWRAAPLSLPSCPSQKLAAEPNKPVQR